MNLISKPMMLFIPSLLRNKEFMDLTGRFPHCSSRGNTYILIVYDHDSNAILGTALKNRQAATLSPSFC